MNQSVLSRLVAVLLLLVMLPKAAFAEEDVPLAKDSKAPFTGILVPVDAYSKIIKDKADQTALSIKLATFEELLKLHDDKYNALVDIKQQEANVWKRQAEDNAKRSFIEQHGFQLGLVLGCVATIAIVFAASQAIKVLK